MRSPVRQAVLCGDLVSLERLLQLGSSPNRRRVLGVAVPERTPLEIAIERSDCAAVRLLLVAGARLDEFSGGLPPLARAAQLGRAEVIRSLLDAGAQPNQPDSNGTPPICYAAVAGQTEVVGLLVDAGGVPEDVWSTPSISWFRLSPDILALCMARSSKPSAEVRALLLSMRTGKGP